MIDNFTTMLCLFLPRSYAPYGNAFKWLRKIIYVIASKMKYSEAISNLLRLLHSASLHSQ